VHFASLANCGVPFQCVAFTARTEFSCLWYHAQQDRSGVATASSQRITAECEYNFASRPASRLPPTAERVVEGDGCDAHLLA
jgi:hypothetical protein